MLSVAMLLFIIRGIIKRLKFLSNILQSLIFSLIRTPEMQ
uniref:Uncharacterized protein n=1 Tax=Klebsiella pneumoniae TaxID=573 RepID=A0A6H0ABH8_KLEPN|nr:hypothetical protein [Klebsiella pneumoniae]QLG00448.1 hypothetical protein [Klebsiella pneumoniae]QLG01398.1 hypothetical protein [Klebsiella pneumoniae]